MTQPELVKESLVAPGLRPRHLRTFTYEIEGPIKPERVPEQGAIVETRAGVYWRVLLVVLVKQDLDDADSVILRIRLSLDPIKAHSVEAHGSVTYLRGGVLCGSS